MDFLLKKFISTFLMPLPLGVILIVLGLLFFYKNKQQKAKVTLILSVIWLFLFSYSPFANILLHSIESTYPTLHQAPKEIRYIYVLGGGHTTDESQPITSEINPISVIRLNEGIRLYHQLDEKPIIITSGYSGLYDPTPGAIMQERLALALGVKQEKIHVETTPKDTQEEALAAKKYIGDAPFILVTSASHMARAMKFFKHEGLNPIPAPTNHMASTQHPNYTDIFSSYALLQSSIAMHEIVGLLWQKIKGI